MDRIRRWIATAGLLLLCCMAGGCLPLPDAGSDDEKNPLITTARSQRSAYQYQDAARTLERALEANPKSVLAHWEMGLLCYQQLGDHAGAIYHLKKVLELNPEWRQKETARQMIDASKVELCKTAPIEAQTPQLQRKIDKLTEQHMQLTKENQRLREGWQNAYVETVRMSNEVVRLQAQVALLSAPKPALVVTQFVAQPVRQPVAAPRVAQAQVPEAATRQGGAAATATPRATQQPQQQQQPATRTPQPVAPAAAAQAKPRTCTVQSGETLASVARRTNVRLADLQAANPGVDARRLRPGQVLRLPAR